MRVNKNSVDVVRIFLTYTLFVGDVEKTATSLDIDPEVVSSLAASEGWDTKLKRVCLLSKTGKPGDWEKAQHRAMCYVQAHQLRGLMDKILAKFGEMDKDELADAMSNVAKDGSKHISSRFFADLAAAMEKSQQMGYAALGDTLTERAAHESPDSEALNATALHAAVTAALNNPLAKAIDVASVVKTAVEEAAAAVSE